MGLLEEYVHPLLAGEGQRTEKVEGVKIGEEVVKKKKNDNHSSSQLWPHCVN